MAVTATDSFDLRLIGKYLLLVLLLFTGCNHLVRELGRNPIPAPTGLDDWSLLHTGPLISGLNGTRIRLGQSYMMMRSYCPQTGYTVCSNVIDYTRIGLGLH